MPNETVGSSQAGRRSRNHNITKMAASVAELAALCCRYILPKGGVLRDPSCGSGSMIVAGLDEGTSRVIGIDREAKYLDITRRRVHST